MDPKTPPSPPHPLDREHLGRIVRAEWTAWCVERAALTGTPAKPSHLDPWEAMPEEVREVDRRIGAAVAAEVVRGSPCGLCMNPTGHEELRDILGELEALLKHAAFTGVFDTTAATRRIARARRVLDHVPERGGL